MNEIMPTEKKMVRGIATTSKVPVAPGLLKEEKLIFQGKIQNLLLGIKFRKNLLLTVGNTTFKFFGVQSVPVK